MKNKKLLLIVSIVLAMTMSLGGTLAYLTDTDAEVNVMTVGNVIIDLIEQQRNDNGDALEDFEQGKTMLPIVGSAQGEKDAFGLPKAANYVDKIVSVKNTGKSEAWVRVLYALPANLENADATKADGPLHGNIGNRVDLNGDYTTEKGDAWQTNWQWTYGTASEKIQINGVDYNVYCTYYKQTLAPGAQTSAALAGFYLDSGVDYDADNGYYTFNGAKIEGFNGNVVIPVLAQAVQASGFTTYTDAFEAAFPYTKEATNDELTSWFNSGKIAEDMPTVVAVKTAEELQKALNDAKGTTIINLFADIDGDVTVTQKADVKITIDGGNKNYDGTITVDGKSARYETAGVTIQNINFEADSINADAYINLGKSGDNNTRYTNNVTVSGCTFNYNGEEDKVAIKSYTGGDWNLTVDGCTVENTMHSLLQVTNVEKGLTITGCKVYSKNGINLNNTPYLQMSGCTFDTKGYCVRFGVNGTTLNGNFTIANSTLKSACDDGDAVIIFRGTATGSTLTLTNTTVEGTTKTSGTASISGLSE